MNRAATHTKLGHESHRRFDAQVHCHSEAMVIVTAGRVNGQVDLLAEPSGHIGREFLQSSL
jgi:hypothetical protein